MGTVSLPELVWIVINAIGLGYGIKIWRQSLQDYTDIAGLGKSRQIELFQADVNKKVARALTWIMILFLGVGLVAAFVPSESNAVFAAFVVFALVMGDILVVYVLIQIDSGRSKLRQMIGQVRNSDRQIVDIHEGRLDGA